jgi:hypothetical protein
MGDSVAADPRPDHTTTRDLQDHARAIGAELITTQGLDDLRREAAAATTRKNLLIGVNVQLYELERSLPWLMARRVRRIRKPVADHIFRSRP